MSVGGQIPNNLALPLHKAGVNILGTCPEMIDCAGKKMEGSIVNCFLVIYIVNLFFCRGSLQIL